jgi:hypothetical protein
MQSRDSKGATGRFDRITDGASGANASCRLHLRMAPGRYLIVVAGYDKTDVSVVAGRTVRTVINFNMY